MTPLELVRITTYFLALIFVIFTIGFNLIFLISSATKTQFKSNNLFTSVGLIYLTGIGSLSFFGLAIGLLQVFYKELIFVFLILNPILFFFLRKQFWDSIAENFLSSLKTLKSPFVIVLAIFCALIITALYLSALMPPLISDELHYHLPQANLLIKTHSITPDTWGHSLYGAIPKLMEILFATGIIIQGYEMTHLFHYSILVAFLVFVFGFVTEYFSAKSAAVAILFLSLYSEFTSYALLAFVDTATVCFEITSLLTFLDWLINKRPMSLLFSTLAIGFALSIKYSALFTLGFMFILLVFYIFTYKKKLIINQKGLLIYALLIFTITTGYWYIKNFILYLNPTYPLYFGHSGMTEDEYRSMINAIQEFGERSLLSFLRFPFKYFYFEEITTFLAFFLPIIALFIKKNRFLILTLLGYYLSFILYWFFLATHQTRFMMTGMVCALILTSICLTTVNKKGALLITFVITALIIIGNFERPFYRPEMFKNYYQYKLHLKDRQYALGSVNRQTLLYWNFGCQYSIIDHLQKNNLNGAVIDNWTVWHDQSASFYAENNRYLNFYFPESTSSANLKNALSEKNIKYIYFKESIKNEFAREPDPVEQKYFLQRIDVEDYLLQKSTLLFKDIDCNLFQIDYQKL